MAIISILGWFFAKVYGFFRGVKTLFTPQSKTTESSSNSWQSKDEGNKKEKQIISNDEGEYVEFEEVKE